MGVLQRGDPLHKAPDMHYSLPTPDCPKCGPTDYEAVMSTAAYTTISGGYHVPTRRQWQCVKCGTPMFHTGKSWKS